MPRGRPRKTPEMNAETSFEEEQEYVAPVKNGVKVKLLKNYRPKGDFKVMERDFPDDPESRMVERSPLGSREIDGKPATGEWAKVSAGVTIVLDADEARRVVMVGIGKENSLEL